MPFGGESFTGPAPLDGVLRVSAKHER
ncbi:MAG: hypothetical protein QOD01_1186, partial [Actinomycetota bacterium]|nr:hypothetical protein [Actinomycetota bacterium]